MTLIALLAAASLIEMCPDPPRADSVEALYVEGQSPSLVSWTENIDKAPRPGLDRGRIIEVTQRYTFDLSNAGFSVSYRGRGTPTCMKFWADGLMLKASVSTMNGKPVIGARVPPGSNELVLKFVILLDSTSLTALNTGLASWRGPSGRYSIVVSGIEKTPATHLQVWTRSSADEGEDYEGPNPVWNYREGNLVSAGIARLPPTLAMRFGMDTNCERRDCTHTMPREAFNDYCRTVCERCSEEFEDVGSWEGIRMRGQYDAASLRLARDWILAREGQPFVDVERRSFFAGQPWYCPAYDVASSMLPRRPRAMLGALDKAGGFRTTPR